MPNQAFARRHPHIGRSAMQRLPADARAHLTAQQHIDSFISDMQWVNHRHKLVGEALRGLHHIGVEAENSTASPADVAALHAVMGEFVLILASELDDALAGLREMAPAPPVVGKVPQ